MSFHRENVIWQSPNGTWNLAFYRVHEYWGDSDDYDPEWDVEYDYDSFEWLSRGHASAESAGKSWRGANPGCSTVLKGNSEYVRELESIAEKFSQSSSVR